MSLITKQKTHRFFKYVSFLTLSMLLASCQNTSTSKLDGSLQASSAYDSLIASATGEKKDELLIKKATALLLENNPQEAEKVLAKVSATLNPKLQAEKQLVSIESAIAQGQFNQAQKLIESIDAHQLIQNDKYRLAKARVNSFNNKASASLLRAYIILTPLAPKEEQQKIIDESWRVMANIPRDDLKNIIITADEFIIQGWLELRNIYDTYRDAQENKGIIDVAIDNWRIRHPHNPAADLFPNQFFTPGPMPSGFNQSALLSDTAINSNAKVALLLPLSGSKQTTAFGNAIKAGFENAQNVGLNTNTSQAMSVIDELTGTAPSVSTSDSNTQITFNVYDTNTQDVNAILIEAEQTGVTTVVGPLLKTDVDKVAGYTGPLQILALNAPETLSSNPKICYFALSPEDEAMDAARHMFEQGKRSALLLVPYGNLGERIATAFNEQWMQLTGSNAVVRTLHEINDLKIMGASGDPLDIKGPIRSNNVDSIYIIAESEKLLIVKPIIDAATQGKSTVGIYASSRSNRNSLRPDFRLEMQGVQFSDVPLLSTPSSASYQSAMDHVDNDYSLARLFAMGIDAYKLTQQFSSLSTNSNFTLQGETGLISVANNCEITRKLVWLQFDQGMIKLAPDTEPAMNAL